MVDRAFEKIGDGREVDMWVRAHVHALPDVEMRRAELVDEDEGPDHRPRLVGQGPPHLERAEIVGRGGYDVNGSVQPWQREPRHHGFDVAGAQRRLGVAHYTPPIAGPTHVWLCAPVGHEDE